MTSPGWNLSVDLRFLVIALVVVGSIVTIVLVGNLAHAIAGVGIGAGLGAGVAALTWAVRRYLVEA